MSLPYEDEAFDRAFTIHCLYFWAEPIKGLREIRRVLRSQGVLAITILLEDKWPPGRRPPADVFTLYSSREVTQLAVEAGFQEARVEASPQPDKFPGECILAVK